MRTHVLSFIAPLAVILVAPHSHGQFIVPEQSLDGWSRGETPFSTYGEWDVFSSPSGPNAPNDSAVVGLLRGFNPGFDAYDSNAETSFSFVTGGGNIYSFSGIVAPEIVSPGFGLGYGYRTTVFAQVRTLGSEPDLESFHLNGRRVPAEIVVLSKTDVGGGFGGTEQDTFVRFEVGRNDAEHAVRFEALDLSMSFDIGLIDTYTEPLACAADVDVSGSADFLDALVFLEDAQADDADWDADGVTDADDVSGFAIELDTPCAP